MTRLTKALTLLPQHRPQHLPSLWDPIPSAPAFSRERRAPLSPCAAGPDWLRREGRGGAEPASDASAGRVTCTPLPGPPGDSRIRCRPRRPVPFLAFPELSVAPGSAERSPASAARSPAPRAGQPAAALGQVSARRRPRGRGASRGAAGVCGGGGGKGRLMRAPGEVLEAGGVRSRRGVGRPLGERCRALGGRYRGDGVGRRRCEALGRGG